MKISATHLTQWTQELSLLLNAHLSLEQALRLLSLSSPHSKLRLISQQLHEKILHGIPLSHALKTCIGPFDETYCQLVSVGEESGQLSSILQRIAYQKKMRLRVYSQIIKALSYPFIVLLVGLSVTALLLLYVTPQIASVFLQFKQPLPMITTLVLLASSAIGKALLPLLLFLSITGSITYIIYRRSTKFYLFISRQVWKSPIGLFYQYAACILFSNTLSLLLSAGLPIAYAFSISTKIFSQPFVKQRLTDALQLLHQGHSFHYVLQQTYLFPPLALHLWKIGEYTGKLSELLDDTALYYQEQLDLLTERLTQWVEPVLLIFLGILIGGIVIAMYLPLFNLGLVIGS